jgi:hypothetical protein
MSIEEILSELSSGRACQLPFGFSMIAASISVDRNKYGADWWRGKIEALLPYKKLIEFSEKN